MKVLTALFSCLSLAGCAMTVEEMQTLNTSMNQLNQSAQGWGQQWRQQAQQYSTPLVQPVTPYGNPGGETYTQVGDAVVGSNGVTYHRVGNSIVGSDGTTCQIVGQNIVCR